MEQKADISATKSPQDPQMDTLTINENIFEQAKRSVNSTASNLNVKNIEDKNKELQEHKVRSGLSNFSSKLGNILITTKDVNISKNRLNTFFKLRKAKRL
jgi:hypothetical protein